MVSFFSCLVKDTKCWEHGESDWMPVGGKQPLHFPWSFLGTEVRYHSKVGVAPVGAASCLPLPTSGQSSSKATPCSTMQKELDIAASSRHVPQAPRELCSGIWQALKPSGFPRGAWEEIYSARGGHRRAGCVRLWLLWIRSPVWKSTGLWPARQVWGGWLAGFTTNPSIGQQGSVTPGPRPLFSRCWACSGYSLERPTEFWGAAATHWWPSLLVAAL